jgi:hypothetical protein
MATIRAGTKEMRTEQNKSGLADGVDDRLTLHCSPLNPLLPSVLAPSAKAVSCDEAVPTQL